jgi:hypothetical protein
MPGWWSGLLPAGQVNIEGQAGIVATNTAHSMWERGHTQIVLTDLSNSKH